MKITTVEPKSYIKLRIIATLIDYAIFAAFYYVYLYVFDQNPDTEIMEVRNTAFMPVLGIWILYFAGTEAINGATPGHDICKLKVVYENGKKISFPSAFLRRICDIIDFGFCGIPALICATKTAKYQRIGDLLAGTLVVKKDDIIEQEVEF